MKVVHLLPALEQGGVENVVCSLNRTLTGSGHESVIVSHGGRLVETILADGGRHVTLDLKSKNLLSIPFRVLRLRRLLRTEKPDLVCVHSRVPAWLFVWANKTRHIPWISYAHGANSVSAYSSVMTRGDRIVAPSKFLADYLTAHYSFDRSKLRIISPCVDLMRFDPENLDLELIARLRREWNISETDHVIMAVGRITPIKGLDVLIREFAAKRREDSRLKLVIVGDADARHQSYLNSLKGIVSSLGLDSGSVVFAGHKNRIPECLAIASEIVSANVTKPESFGLSVAEALAMNRPVRLFRHFGGAAEILDAVTSYTAPTTREAVRALYGFDIMSSKTQDVYAELLKCPPIAV